MELKLSVGRIPDPVEYLAAIEEVVVLGWEHDCEGSVSKLSHKQNVGVRIPRTPPPLVYRSQSLVIPSIAANHLSSRLSQPITGHPVYRSQSLVILSIAVNHWSSRLLQPITGHPLYRSQSLVIPSIAANHCSSRLSQPITGQVIPQLIHDLS